MMPGFFAAGANGGGAPPSGTWVPYFVQSVGSNSGISSNSMIRQVIPIAGVTPCTKVRVTLHAASTSSFQVGKIAVGIKAASGDVYDYAAAPVVGSFSGSAGVTIPASSEVVSDPIDIVVTSGQTIVVGIYVVAGLTFYSNAANGAYKLGSGDETEVVNASGYTVTTSNGFAITKIEFFVPD